MKIRLYTENNVFEFDVVDTKEGFYSDLVQGIENGTVMLDTDEGSHLVINAINVVAMEIIPPRMK